MERTGFCLIDGRPVATHEARISAFDRGFLYADGIFETFRVYNGHAFRLDQHWSRLLDSAAFFRLVQPEADPRQLVDTVLEANRLRDASIRVTLSRGTLPNTPRPDNSASSPPTILVQARPLRPDLLQLQEQGMQSHLTPWPTRAQGSPLHQHKTLAYLSSILALASAPPGQEAILWNSHGHIAEGATSNIFWVRNGIVYTPSIEAGCLPGVTRNLVLELAREAGLPIAEGLYPGKDLLEADEAWLTNSVMEICPLVAVDHHPVGGKTPGPITRALQHAYRALVIAEGAKS